MNQPPRWIQFFGIVFFLPFWIGGCGGGNTTFEVVVIDSGGDEMDSERFYIDRKFNETAYALKRFLRNTCDGSLPEGMQFKVSAGDPEGDDPVSHVDMTYQIKGTGSKKTLCLVQDDALKPVLLGFKSKGVSTYDKEFTNAIAEILAGELDAYNRKRKKTLKRD